MSFLSFPPQPASTASSAEPAPAAPVGVAPRYDLRAKDIAIGADGEPLLGNIYEALADEIVMGLLVRRGTSAAWPPGLGTAFDADAAQPTPSLQAAAFQADVTAYVAALKAVDPSIKSVGSFTFNRTGGDTGTFSFIVTPAVGPSIPVTIPYPYGGLA